MLLYIAIALILSIEQAIDQLLSLLLIATKALATNKAKDIAIQQALDKVLKYYKTYKPKNTTKNYKLKQRE